MCVTPKNPNKEHNQDIKAQNDWLQSKVFDSTGKLSVLC